MAESLNRIGLVVTTISRVISDGVIMATKTISIECVECTCERWGRVWIPTTQRDTHGKWGTPVPLVPGATPPAMDRTREIRKAKKEAQLRLRP